MAELPRGPAPSFISYAQNGEDVMLRRALRDVEAGFYIDIGAAEPQADSVTCAFYRAGWRGLNVEPAPGAFDRLRAQRSRDINLNIACGAQDGEVNFHLVDGGNGLSTARPDLRDTYAAQGAVLQQIQVGMRSLRSLVAEHVTGPVHFLKIDVEGSEGDVLAGADFSSFRPWIILVEATVPNTREPSHAGWEALLLTAGYDFVWFDGLNRFYTAVERPALRDAFRVQPNVFDNFICADQAQARAEADTLRAILAAPPPPVFLHAVGRAGGSWLARRFAASRLGYTVCEAVQAEDAAELIAAARGRPVLLGPDLFVRVSALLAAHGGVHIYLWRHPWDQFWAGQTSDKTDAAALGLLAAETAPPVLASVAAGLGLPEPVSGHPAWRAPDRIGLRLEQRYALFYALWLYGWLETRPACQADIDIDRLAEPAYREALQTRLAALGMGHVDLCRDKLPRGEYTAADAAWFETQEREIQRLFVAAGYEMAALAEAERGVAAARPQLALAGAARPHGGRAVRRYAVREALAWAALAEQAAAREAAEARIAALEDRGAAAQAPAAATEEQRAAAQAGLRAHEAAVRAREAEQALAGVRAQLAACHASASWQATRPLRFFGHLTRRRPGLALMEAGLSRRTLEGWKRALRPGHKAWKGMQPAFAAPAAPPLAALPAAKPRAAARRQHRGRVGDRPVLAMVTPLPPARTGIAAYCADLLPELAKHYDIRLITEAQTVSFHPPADVTIHGPNWLLANAGEVDRVLYHIGNSPFHAYMLPLLAAVPGAVVLHDFFLSDLLAGIEHEAPASKAWVKALYASHGYPAVRHRYFGPSDAATVARYPANLPVLAAATGVIVHSHASLALGADWYGKDFCTSWRVIPHLRAPGETDRAASRAALGLPPETFLVCSFGHLGRAKLNHRLLEAWLQSGLTEDRHCQLVFVGETTDDSYPALLMETCLAGRKHPRIRITGWVDRPTYQTYLAAADAAVQLRGPRRGETSGAVLDCMAQGCATIVNASGALVELPADSVWALPADFEDTQLINALQTLRHDGSRRAALGQAARAAIVARHAPAACAAQFASALEDLDQPARFATAPQPVRRLFVDVTATRQQDLRTGIQRVVRAATAAMLDAPIAGWRIEPVYLTDAGGRWHYRYARDYALNLLGCPPAALDDEVLAMQSGDALLGLDLVGSVVEAACAGLLAGFRDAGAAIYFVVYDLLPLTLPACFPAEAAALHAAWLRMVAAADGAFCISRSVADELAAWYRDSAVALPPGFRIDSFPLGADIESSLPTTGMPRDAASILNNITRRPAFLMTGTLEPRKNYAQALAAFEALWRGGIDVTLVIAGKQGWMVDDLAKRMQRHPERGTRLFWLDAPSDEFLQRLYKSASCLIAASGGEGFGLPLIEAARHGLPIIARDLPVFREVAGPGAHYFSGDAADLAGAVRVWLALHAAGAHPKSGAMPLATWQDCASRLLDLVARDTAPPDCAPQAVEPLPLKAAAE